MLELASPAIRVGNETSAPPNIPHPEWAIPDEVVARTARRYGLLRRRNGRPAKIGIDPMCGTGSIPAIINRLDGDCHANELLPSHCDITEARLPPGVALRQGDFAHLRRSLMLWERYDYIYTSPSFSRFIGEDLDAGQMAFIFQCLLKRRRLLLLDSAATVVRNGKICHAAAYTILYFRYFGFKFIESICYEVDTPWVPGGDTQFVELAFTAP